jgi:2-polyprenyl-3-methyl-5-hydroxy-6-metoxy-1,4-benzoquinol methylase
MRDPRDYEHEHSHGGMWRQAYADDPKRLAFTLSRYKHTAKLLEGLGHVLEVGCADGFGTRIVRQHVGALTAIDTDERSIEEAKLASSDQWPVSFQHGALTVEQIKDCPISFDAVYALDVLEHIRPDDEFLRAMAAAAPVAVIGTPSAESQKYASAMSKLGHVNCYSGADLRTRLLEFWERVFLFTMHDEILGTSYTPMAQYLLALCVGSR